MASVDLKAELECAICLDTYTDPVMLKCGHNFCKQCIDGVQNIQGVYSCPECRQKFGELHRNMKLRNIVEILSAQKCDALCSIHDKVLEYYCTEDHTCVCVSCCLIGDHKAHKMESLQEAAAKKKETVKKVLQKLLTQRQKIEERVSCLQRRRANVNVKADGDTEKVTKLFRDLRRRMKSLEERTLNEISKQAQHVSRSMLDRIREMEISKKDLSNQIQDIETLCNAKDPLTVLQASNIGNLCDTKDEINDELDKRLHEAKQKGMAEQAKHVSPSMLDRIQELEISKKDLSNQIQDIKPLCNTKDPLTVLQASNISNLCDTKDEHEDKLLHDAEQMDMAKISQKLQTGLSNIMAGVRAQKLTGTNLYSDLSREDDGPIIALLSERVPQPASTMQSPHQLKGPSIQTVLQMLGISHDSDLTLDINTAGNDLCISENMKTVTWSLFTQKYPERAERFQCAQVISTQSFSSGQHYWEVDVERSQVWSVGMCYRSIDRRGGHSEIGWNNKSWGLHKSWLNGQYSVLYDRKWMRLHGKVSSNRVMIYVDYEAGQISFYDLCHPIQHLYTFNSTFTEPLHAVLWVGAGCVKVAREHRRM